MVIVTPVPALVTALLLLGTQPGALPDAPGPALLVVLAPTGDVQDGLPVYVHHQQGAEHVALLERGFSGRLLRLFRLVQQFLHMRDGRPVEPAYLLLSTNQGGFPRFGFWLDGERKDDVGYVDLHQRSALAGRYGAVDQIFPHELMHVIVQQLAGPAAPGMGGANQLHAIAVRTDRITAFSEGIAESVQVLSIDDPDAHSDTRALASDVSLPSITDRRLVWYARTLEARWAPAPPARMGFVMWFGQAEQVMRYHAVKANAFALEPPVSAKLLAQNDPYAAYLVENMLPGETGAPVKSTGRLLATEGVIASLFSKWVIEPALGGPAPSADLLARFGTSLEELTPLDHAYLKLFTVLADARPHDAAALMRAYVEAYPHEAEAVGALVRGQGLSWPLPDVPEIWMANRAFSTGTSLYDQYRALPRVHTFDLNAASVVDLRSVEGVSTALARTILARAPYRTVEELTGVDGVTPGLVDRFRKMAEDMETVREDQRRQDAESIDLMQIFRPVLVRVGIWILAGAAAAGWLYGRVRKARVRRLFVNGLAAAALGLLATWVLGAGLEVDNRALAVTVLPLTPLVVFGLPGSLWMLLRRGDLRAAGAVLGAWALACLPALILTRPLF